jgi:hypothetical protein
MFKFSTYAMIIPNLWFCHDMDRDRDIERERYTDRTQTGKTETQTRACTKIYTQLLTKTFNLCT